MYRYAIFDLDGTLLNTVHALWVSVNLTLADLGYGPVTEDQIKVFIGDGYRILMERALRSFGEEALVHHEESLPLYLKHFSEHSMDGVVPYDGIPELLEGLKKRGMKLAVFSNKPNEQTLYNIETVFGPDCFDYVAGETAGVPRKPDPAGVYRILRFLDEVPGEGLYFGDTNTDMKTGLAAGLTTVGVLWGFRDRKELEEFHPQYIISRPQEVFTEIPDLPDPPEN